MSNTKFTKGKWIIIETDTFPENEITTQERIGDSKDFICGIDTLYDSPHGIEQKANAHLIASAPDMYAMLDVLSTDLQVMLGERSDQITSDINKLLAKARGESCNNK